MKRLFILIAALLLSSAASAAWRCLPADIGGTGSKFVTFSNANGKARGWFCPAPGQTYYRQTLVVLNSYVPPAGCATSVADLLNTATSGTTTIESANALLAKCGGTARAGTDSDNYRALTNGAYDLIDKAFVAQLVFPTDPTTPPPKVYQFFVSANSASTAVPNTRPVYEFNKATGVRGTKSVGTVVTGSTPCDPLIASTGSGSSTYMAFGPAFAADRVTVCSKPK